MSKQSPSPVSFRDVANYLCRPEIKGDFPSEILLQRLELTGAREILERQAIANEGFPLRYHNPLDEAILVLYHFLIQAKNTLGSYIQLNSTHVPSKEEENTLSFWKTPKAGLYLDLHAMIENHNHSMDKHGLLKRVFVFRDHAQFAFLESTGIGVILEQESIGIETGFFIARERQDNVSELTKGGVVLIQLLHDDDNKCKWFVGIDKTDPGQQPYKNRLICRWHEGRVLDKATRRLSAEALREKDENQIDLKRYLDLFKFQDGKPQSKVGDRSYRIERSPERFRQLLEAHFHKAFPLGEVAQKDFDDHLNLRAIPRNYTQFFLALEQIGQSTEIRAIDASSAKNTLRVHEADPNYRHWIRTSVQRALKNGPEITLERLYILRETEDEYEIFRQEIDLYGDFLSGRVSKLERGLPESDSQAGPERSHESSYGIRLYAITMEVVEEICRDLTEQLRKMLIKLVAEAFDGKPSAEIGSILTTMDFLCSEKCIFNYKDYRGEPGRAFYDADLFLPRDGKDGESEQALFDIVKYETHEDFEKRRSSFLRLFEILKKRSIQVLPSELSTPANLEDFVEALATRGSTPLVMSELDKVQPKNASESSFPKIFVSYATEDSEKVDVICQRIDEAGYRYWDFRKHLLPGQKGVVHQNLQLSSADFVLCCLSSNYNEKYGEVQAEIVQAVDKAKRVPETAISLLLVRLDDCDRPWSLSEFWFVDLFEKGRWQESAWKKVLQAIEEERGRRTSFTAKQKQ
jgi:hypothetical protein